jgi:cyanophycin synthetase
VRRKSLPSGVTVLNAADAMAVEMEPLCDGEVIYYAADPMLDVIKAHLAKGGRAVVVRAGELILATAETETPIAPLSIIPFIQSDDEPLKLASMLASVAAAWALDISLHVIRTGVETYSDAIFDRNQPELPLFDASIIRA